MEPIDRYLQAVGLYLPGARRENLRAEISDREAQLGRPLEAAEWYSLVILVSLVAVVDAGVAVGAAIAGTSLLTALSEASVAAAICSLVNVVRPIWAFFRSLSRIAIDGMGLVIASLALQSDGLLVFIAGGRQLSMVADIITWSICFSFILAFALDSITEACHLIRRGGRAHYGTR